MLSCIICSRRQDISAELKDNIKNTIGCEYELIIIDNSDNKYSIFSAYNEGVRRSSGEVLCFMHEDILYHSSNWGYKVFEHFSKNNIGLIGVEGTHYVPKYPAPWWASAANSGQLIQGNTVNGVYSSVEESLWGRKEHNSIEGVIVDGLWMCIPTKLFKDNIIRFDDNVFCGFHCYDADICMQVINNNYDVRIIFDILIEHKSLGKPDAHYFDQLDIWYNKWKDNLPIYKGIILNTVDAFEKEKISINYSNLFRNNQILIDRINKIYNSKTYKLKRLFSSIIKIKKYD